MSWVSSFYNYITGASTSTDESLPSRADRRLSEISTHSEEDDNRRLSSTLGDLQESLPESFLTEPSPSTVNSPSTFPATPELTSKKDEKSEPVKVTNNLNDEEQDEEQPETKNEHPSPSAVNTPSTFPATPELTSKKDEQSEPVKVTNNLNDEEQDEEDVKTFLFEEPETKNEHDMPSDSEPDSEYMPNETEQTESESDSGSSAKTAVQKMEVDEVSRKRKADESLSDQQDAKRTKLETQDTILTQEPRAMVEACISFRG